MVARGHIYLRRFSSSLRSRQFVLWGFVLFAVLIRKSVARSLEPATNKKRHSNSIWCVMFMGRKAKTNYNDHKNNSHVRNKPTSQRMNIHTHTHTKNVEPSTQYSTFQRNSSTVMHCNMTVGLESVAIYLLAS